MPQTVKQLRDKIRRLIFTTREAENLVEQHNWHFLEALALIQQDVVCEQARNANVIRFCNTHFKCGLTVVPAVRGVIKFLYTIANDDWCDPVIYKQGTLNEVQCFLSQCRTWEEPETPGIKLPLGFVTADAARDSTLGRSRVGMFAIDGPNLWLSPWIQSTEKAVIEWRGVKTAEDWSDDDPVSEQTDFAKAVKLYMQYAHERDFGDLNKSLRFKNPQHNGEYDDAVSDLIIRCHEETRVREDDVCRRCPTWAQLEDEQPAEA